MRTRFALAIISLLALLAALGSFVPTATHAAPALRPSNQSPITGTLVATPQAAAPTTLLLQVGSQTIPVSISVTTQITDRNLNPLSLSALNDGDTLQVVGDPNAAGGIDATLVEDLTTPVATPPPPTYTLTVQGTLAAAPSAVTVPPSGYLCLANANVISSNIRPNIATTSICPSGQLPVYLTSSTQILGPSGQAYTLGQLAVGDTLQVNGTLTNTQFTAATVQDLTTPVTPPPPPTYSVTVQGILAGGPTLSGNLCLANANVISSNIRPNIATTSVCPGGQLPIQLTGATQFLGPSGQPSSGGYLQLGDALQVSGTVTNTQFTATVVQDLTTHAPPPLPTLQITVEGTLTNTPLSLSTPACLRNARLVGNLQRVRVLASSACPAGEMPMYISARTRIVQRNNRSMGLYGLRAGDTIVATGTIANARFTASLIRDFSINRTYNTLLGTVLYVNPAANGAYFTMRVQSISGLPGWNVPGRYAVITVYVQVTTQIIINGVTTNQVTVLNPGQQVTVLGVYNSHNHHCTDTFRVRVH